HHASRSAPCGSRAERGVSGPGNHPDLPNGLRGATDIVRRGNVKRTRSRALALVVLGSTLGLAGLPATTVAVAAATVSTPVDVTNDHFANNEESLGMSPSGQLLAGAWNDWEYNDGCGFSYSTDGGGTWAPETFVPGLTLFTNDPDVPGTGRFAIAGDPAVAYNPSSGVFDVMCQAFGHKGNQAQLLLTTFDPAKADPNADVNDSYGSD